MMDISKEQLVEILPLLKAGNINTKPQNNLKANTWRKRKDLDGKIDWRMDAKNIHNLIRGLTRPYIGAHFSFQGCDYKVWKSKVINSKGFKNIEPGKVIVLDHPGLPCIRCGKDFIQLLEVEPKLNLIEGTYL